jgi:hypothetical protein
MTKWDARAATRAFVLAAVAFAVAWLVTATTDEGGVAWGVRAGRTLPIAPVCAAVGTAIVLAQARARGEARALEALGRSPWENAAAAAAGGAMAAILAAIVMGASTKVDVDGFFPVAHHGVAYKYDAGGFVDRASGWRIEADGAIARVAADPAASAMASLPRNARASAALSTAFAGLALPLLGAHVLLTRPLASRGARRSRFGRGSPARAFAVVVAAAVASILSFHAAAVGRLPALVAATPMALLLVAALFRYRSSRWDTAGSKS